MERLGCARESTLASFDLQLYNILCSDATSIWFLIIL